MSAPKYGYWEVVIEKQGRLKLPAALIKALPEDERKELWITHGYGKHIMLWTVSAFNEKMESLDQLNPNDVTEKKYRNAFLHNLTHADLDSQDRFVVPKALQELYNLKKEVALVLAKGQIEVWDLEEYNKEFGMSPDEFSLLNQEMDRKSREEKEKKNNLGDLINNN